ncbi:MAG: hypothetical protein CR984_00005 [Proteobacteria bacterium]|nr:MAG: hypothetical protein CR984_00005 [Pseudomonadota bacterium]
MITLNKRAFLVLAGYFALIMGCRGTMPNLGIEKGKFQPCPNSPNCVSSQATDEKHFIEPLLVNATPDEAKKHILRILDATKSSKVVAVEGNYIRTEFVSKVFRFVDDVEFFISDRDTETSIIHVRSASRVGHFDFGVNRKRIENIRSRINDLLGAPYL